MSYKKNASNSDYKIDMVCHLIVKSGLFRKKKATVIIHKEFLKYLKDHVKDKTIEKELFNDLSDQALERFEMLNNRKNPLYGDEEKFELYRRAKYKMLYEHIDLMLKYARGQ